MNVPKPSSKPYLLSLIGIVIVGIPLTIYALLHQQIFQQNAWYTQQSAVTQCSSQLGSAVILVTFANTETNKDMNVTVNDLQTGQSVNMGTIKAMDSKTANIVTGKTSLAAGSVVFHLSWADGSAGTDQRGANYNAINNCPVNTNPNFCPDNSGSNQGTCSWTPLSGAKGYNVVVKETDNGQLIQSVSLDQNATQSAFPMIPGKPYTCTVTATNVCGTGTPLTSPQKICTGPTPTPTPSPPACLNGNTSQGICTWDSVSSATSYNLTVKNLSTGKTVVSDTVKAPTTQFAFNDNGVDTYECDVTANNICGNSPPAKSPPSTCTSPTPTPPGVTVSPTPTIAVSPTPLPTATPTPVPTATPAPTATPIPTATPKPLPTPTPVVIVKILTPPPQQIIITSPPQQTIVRVPGQTNTIVQQGPPQTIVVTQSPQPTARPYSPVTPVPTVMATGNTTPSIVIAGTSAILLIAGGIIFFLL